MVTIAIGKRLERCWLAGARGLVQGGQLMAQHREGTAIGGGVMHHQRQHMMVGITAQQPAIEAGRVRHIKPVTGNSSNVFCDLLLRLWFRQGAEVMMAKQIAKLGLIQNRACRDAVIGADHGTQRFVADYQRAQGCSKRIGIKITAQIEHQRNIILAGAAFQLIKGP